MLSLKIKSFVCISVVALVAAGFFLAEIRTSAGPSSGFLHFTPEVSPSPGEKKGFSDYKGVAIGATMDAIRLKLGPPKDKTDEQDLYVFSDDESAQFYYDATHQVTAIMITYSGKLTGAPTPKDIFGEDVAPKADGGVFKMVRYPKAGYWISYNRSGGSDAIISIAIQKI